MGIDIYHSKSSFPFLDEFTKKDIDPSQDFIENQFDAECSNKQSLSQAEPLESTLVPENPIDTYNDTDVIVEAPTEEESSSDSQLVEKADTELSSIQFNIFNTIDFDIALASNNDLASIEFLKNDEHYTLLKSDTNQMLFEHLTRLQREFESQTLSQQKKALWQVLSSYSC